MSITLYFRFQDFTKAMNISLLCVAIFIVSGSASYVPRHPPYKYRPSHGASFGGAAGGLGIDPLTLLMLQKDGGLGKIIL